MAASLMSGMLNSTSSRLTSSRSRWPVRSSSMDLKASVSRLYFVRSCGWSESSKYSRQCREPKDVYFSVSYRIRCGVCVARLLLEA